MTGPGIGGFVTGFVTGVGIVIGTGVAIGVAIVIANWVATEFVIGIVTVIVLVVQLNGLFYCGSSYCVGNWWGHGEGYSLGLSPHLTALGEGRCPHSASIL